MNLEVSRLTKAWAKRECLSSPCENTLSNPHTVLYQNSKAWVYFRGLCMGARAKRFLEFCERKRYLKNYNPSKNTLTEHIYLGT